MMGNFKELKARSYPQHTQEQDFHNIQDIYDRASNSYI